MNELLGGDLSPRARERAMGIRAMASGCSNGDVAALVGRSITTIAEWRTRYLQDGAAWVRAQGWGGRRNQLLDQDAERSFVEAFETAAADGGIVTISTIHDELAERVGHDLWPKSVYRVLERHGWRKIAPRPAHPGADPQRREAFKQTSRASFHPPERATPDPSD